MSDPVPCAGCGKQPVNIGNMGRFKFACPTYMARNKATTPQCDGGQFRPMWKWESDAIEDWNDAQITMSEKTIDWQYSRNQLRHYAGALERVGDDYRQEWEIKDCRKPFMRHLPEDGYDLYRFGRKIAHTKTVKELKAIAAISKP